MTLTQTHIQDFSKQVGDFYSANKRNLPWRRTDDPYAIAVSEIMLQQTQVERVIPKYERWMQLFPDIKSLASASLRDVLSCWSGLGYNRRAVFLQKMAVQILKQHEGSFEIFRTFESKPKLDPLLKLPGIGTYTASAIRAFAFNQPVVMIETNIRTVYIHHFFPQRKKISDTELIPIIEATIDRKNPRDWYNALMDYGTFLKSTIGNKSKQSNTYAKQTLFKGSNRQIRGKILRKLLTQSIIKKHALIEFLAIDPSRFEKIMQQLIEEGLVELNEKDQLLIK